MSIKYFLAGFFLFLITFFIMTSVVPAIFNSKSNTTTGRGKELNQRDIDRYNEILRTKDIAYIVKDLHSGKVISSHNTNKEYYGASIAKIFVGGALLHKNDGNLSQEESESLERMITVSSNPDWVKLESEVGGPKYMKKFSSIMGIDNSTTWRGTYKNKYGNVITALDVSNYLSKVYYNRFAGSYKLLSAMSRYKTGTNTGIKFLPKTVIAGKTGHYKGLVGQDTDFRKEVNVNHHVIVIPSKEISIVVLSDGGLSDKDMEILVGGLYKGLLSNKAESRSQNFGKISFYNI